MAGLTEWRRFVPRFDIMLFAIILATFFAVTPVKCSYSVGPEFGHDIDSPIGYDVDGIKLKAKCLF
jgi:hypothetical protein